MPQFKVQTPDGSVMNVDAPEGATEQQAIEFAASMYKPKPQPVDPTQGMSGTEKFLAGAGKAFVDIGRGIGQITGLESDKDIAEAKKLDEPLMRTGAGQAGNIAGNVAALAPTAFIPGANTLVGGAAIGGAVGALQPVAGEESRLSNIGLGASTGAAGKILGDKAGKYLATRAAESAKLADITKAQNAIRDATITSAQAAGYVLPPTQANPSVMNKMLEGFSGKIQTAQKASLKNQPVTNDLIRKGLGLTDDAPITKEVLEEVRSKAGDSYETIKRYGKPFEATPEYTNNIKKLGSEWQKAAKEFPDLVKNKDIDTLVSSLDKKEITPESAITIIKKLRYDAKANLKNFADPEKSALGLAQRKAADAVEGLIDQNLAKTGDRQLLADFRQGRQLIAKSYDVEAALNESTGNVSARHFAKLLEKGKPLTGELKTIAEFARAFPKAAQDVEKIGSQPGFSPLDVATGVIAGRPGKMAAVAGAVLGRPAARSLILSDLYQKGMVKAPTYGVRKGLSLASKAAENEALKRLSPSLLSEAVTSNGSE